MSKLEGGIFSRPRGKTGGIVFGAARTRRGKQTTTRLLVPPSNPNTAAQQEQRSKFKDSLAIVKAAGPDAYQKAFNRTVSQLPGFQSLLSIILNNINAGGNVNSPTLETLLRGSNPLPGDLSRTLVDPSVLTWDDTPLAGGAATDEVFVIAIPELGAGDDPGDTVQFFSGQTIADGATGYTMNNPEAAEMWLAVWTVGSGSNEGVYSNIRIGTEVGV